MGNKQSHTVGTHHQIELDRADAIYLPNEIVSGTVSNLKNIDSHLLLTGVIRFKKHKKKAIEQCVITFFSSTFSLDSSSTTKQNFQFRLNEYLPPSFNKINVFPHVFYSIKLLSNKPKNQMYSSIPIRVCPRVQIDQPLLLAPLLFGPVENQNYSMKLQIKVNRSAFKFGDAIQIYYELQNPLEIYIQKIDVTLGAYYSVESNVSEEDISNSIENFNDIASKQKLIRHKIVLNIPGTIYLPPTFKYKYDQEGDRSLFHLTIDYKVQFKIYVGKPESLWQVDVPIILCEDLVENTVLETTDASQNSETNVVVVDEQLTKDVAE